MIKQILILSLVILSGLAIVSADTLSINIYSDKEIGLFQDNSVEGLFFSSIPQSSSSSSSGQIISTPSVPQIIVYEDHENNINNIVKTKNIFLFIFLFILTAIIAIYFSKYKNRKNNKLKEIFK